MASSEQGDNWRSIGLQALRAPFLTATIVAVLVGNAVAWNDGTYRWDLFIITLVAAVAAHAGTNVLNDYSITCSRRMTSTNTQPPSVGAVG